MTARPLSTAFRRVERPHQVEAGTAYEMMGVRSFGRGCFAGRVREGAELSYSTLHQVRAGDFVYPKLMAWEGAYAFVGEAFADLFVSPEFCLFTVDEQRADREYLELLFQSPRTWERLGNPSRGVNFRRRRLQPAAFLQAELELPDLPDQQASASRLRGVFARCEEVQQLSRRLLDVTLEIQSRALADEFDDPSSDLGMTNG